MKWNLFKWAKKTKTNLSDRSLLERWKSMLHQVFKAMQIGIAEKFTNRYNK